MYNLVLALVMIGTASDNGGPTHTRQPVNLTSATLATFKTSEECQAHMDVAMKGDTGLLMQRDQPMIRRLLFCAKAS